jgi:hypothetical protein
MRASGHDASDLVKLGLHRLGVGLAQRQSGARTGPR